MAPDTFGGTPNIFVAGPTGAAEFERNLNCPSTPGEGEKVFLFVEVAYHSDGMVYGAIPSLPPQGVLFGAVTHTD